MPATHKSKVCATCGKAEGPNWARHWKQQHPTEVMNELVPGEAPAHPFDENWLYLIKDLEVQEIYKGNGSNILPPTSPAEINDGEASFIQPHI